MHPNEYGHDLWTEELNNFIKENNIDVVSAKDPISAFIPTLLKKTTKNNFKLIIEHHGNFLDLLLTQKRFYFEAHVTDFFGSGYLLSAIHENRASKKKKKKKPVN